MAAFTSSMSSSETPRYGRAGMVTLSTATFLPPRPVNTSFFAVLGVMVPPS